MLKYMKIPADIQNRKDDILKAFGKDYFSDRTAESYSRLCRGIKEDRSSKAIIKNLNKEN